VRTWSKTCPGTPEWVRETRLCLARFLDGCPVAEEAVLLAHELCANAVAYSESGRPGGQFSIHAELFEGSYVWVEVQDQGSSWDGNLSGAEPWHGLYLLATIATGSEAVRMREGWLISFTVCYPGFSP
jgi:hypothetical protein